MLVKGARELPRDSKSILLIQLGDIGDVVLTLPTIRCLRENRPESQLIVCVREKARELIDDCPWMSGVLSVNKQKRSIKDEAIYHLSFVHSLRKRKFDLAIELRTGTRGAIIACLSGAGRRIGRFADDGQLWRNRVFTDLVRPANERSQYSAEHNLNILSPFGLSTEHRLPSLAVTPEKREKALTLLRQEGVSLERPLIAFHPFSLWKYKEWGIDQGVALIDYLGVKYGFFVVVTGSLEEQERADQMVSGCKTKVSNLVGKTSIGELPGVLEACRLFIGVDTAALHIAAAVGVATVGIFGPSSPTVWAPRGDQHSVVHKNMSCVPCRQMGCEGSETSRCLEELTFEEVREKVDEHMERLARELC